MNLVEPKDVIRYCMKKLTKEECDTLLDVSLIEIRINKIHRMQEDKLYSLDELGVHVGRRNKRSTPFGIIGTLSKSLFGIANEDYLNLIKMNLDQLFSDQGNILELVREQAIIIQAKIGEIENIVEEQEDILENLASTLELTQLNIEAEQARTLTVAYSSHINEQLDHLMYQLNNIREVYRYLQKGKIHPKLFDRPSMQQIREKIRMLSRRSRQMFQNSRFLRMRAYNTRTNKQKYRHMRSEYMDE
uniref:Uncharacterized protein n=1 Tax=Trichogramma kaykai TaxID=54128 RepID=A0ABD2W549_9HYME